MNHSFPDRLRALPAVVDLRRIPFFRSAARTRNTAGTVAIVAATIALVVLLLPGPRGALFGAPGTVISNLRGSSAIDSTIKGYPRIYSVKLNIDLAIRPGDGHTPPVAPIAFQYPHTADLGQSGNTYLYAHDRPGMFYGLHNAAIGDILVVALAADRKVYYQVTEIHGQVAWNDFAWLRPSGDNRLTLQTCNFSGDRDPRFIVVSKEVPADQAKRLVGDI
jgi:hypothetical protein